MKEILRAVDLLSCKTSFFANGFITKTLKVGEMGKKVVLQFYKGKNKNEIRHPT